MFAASGKNLSMLFRDAKASLPCYADNMSQLFSDLNNKTLTDTVVAVSVFLVLVYAISVISVITIIGSIIIIMLIICCEENKSKPQSQGMYN